MGWISQRRWPATRRCGARCRCSPRGAAMGWWSWTSCAYGGRNWWLWVGSEERWNQGVGQKIIKDSKFGVKIVSCYDLSSEILLKRMELPWTLKMCSCNMFFFVFYILHKKHVSKNTRWYATWRFSQHCLLFATGANDSQVTYSDSDATKGQLSSADAYNGCISKSLHGARGEKMRKTLRKRFCFFFLIGMNKN